MSSAEARPNRDVQRTRQSASLRNGDRASPGGTTSVSSAEARCIRIVHRPSGPVSINHAKPTEPFLRHTAIALFHWLTPRAQDLRRHTPIFRNSCRRSVIAYPKILVATTFLAIRKGNDELPEISNSESIVSVLFPDSGSVRKKDEYDQASAHSGQPSKHPLRAKHPVSTDALRLRRAPFAVDLCKP